MTTMLFLDGASVLCQWVGGEGDGDDCRFNLR